MTLSYSPPRPPHHRQWDAAELLARRHLPLALRLARRFVRPGCSPGRLEEVARGGLEIAARRYDPQLGRFSAFAVPVIPAELRRHRPAPLSRVLTEALIQSADEAFVASCGRRPTATEAARLLRWPVEDVVEARLTRPRGR